MFDTHHPNRPHYSALNVQGAGPWGGMPFELIVRDPVRPYGDMTLDEVHRRPYMLSVQQGPRSEEDERKLSQMTAVLFMAASILLPRTMLWSMTPVLVAGLVAKMLSGSPEEKRRLAAQYGLTEPKPTKHHKREKNEDLDYDLAAAVFLLNPAVEKISGWRYLGILASQLISNAASVGRRGLRAGLRAVQAMEKNILAMTMPHPRMAPSGIAPAPTGSS